MGRREPWKLKGEWQPQPSGIPIWVSGPLLFSLFPPSLSTASSSLSSPCQQRVDFSGFWVEDRLGKSRREVEVWMDVPEISRGDLGIGVGGHCLHEGYLLCSLIFTRTHAPHPTPKASGLPLNFLTFTAVGGGEASDGDL